MPTMYHQLVAQWREAAGDSIVFSASRVQAFLFDLWGETEGRARELVQEWLTVSLHRELFSAEELDGLFGQLDGLVPVG
jgi:hypothetical protein